MNHVKQITVTCIALFWVIMAYGQSSINTSGGEATGSGGTVSYTVGQVVYRTITGANGSVAEGVQQPYEISVVSGIEKAKGISLNVSAYPNPTSNYLTLKVENYRTVNLQYYLFDINGKLLQTVKSTGIETQIVMSNLVTGTYFVRVISNNQSIKEFKIIKK